MANVSKAIVLIAILLVPLAVEAADRSAPCKPAGRTIVELRLNADEGAEVGGVSFALDYPEAAVALPNSGDDRSVKDRVKGIPDGFLNVINDSDDTLRIAIASGTDQLPSKASFSVEFDRCDGASAPAAKDFKCTVESAAMTCGLPLDDVTCEVVLK